MHELLSEQIYQTTCDSLFRAIADGTLFRLTGANQISFNFEIGGKFDLKFHDRGSISGSFEKIELPRKVQLTWNVAGFERPPEATTVHFQIDPLENVGVRLLVKHSGIPLTISAQAKERAWREILDQMKDHAGPN